MVDILTVETVEFHLSAQDGYVVSLSNNNLYSTLFRGFNHILTKVVRLYHPCVEQGARHVSIYSASVTS